MTVSELLDRMTSAEMMEWAALYRIEADEVAHANQVAQNRAGRR